MNGLLAPREVVDAVEDVLRSGFDPADDPPRHPVDVRSGQLLLMPSDIGDRAGVKLVTIAPANVDAGLPLVQGVYLLLDAATLTPRAVIDGAALTALRTPAVSMAATRPVLTRTTDPARIVIFGAGPQGTGHARALTAELHGARPVADLRYVVRRPDGHGHLEADGHQVLATGDPAVGEAVASADIVVCATTSRTPLFDSTLLRSDAVVMAVGAFQPDAREVDGALAGRARVVVEDIDTALRECGEVVLALDEGMLTVGSLVTLRQVVVGQEALPTDRPVLFKGSGMAWQDLAVAGTLASRLPAP